MHFLRRNENDSERWKTIDCWKAEVFWNIAEKWLWRKSNSAYLEIKKKKTFWEIFFFVFGKLYFNCFSSQKPNKKSSFSQNVLFTILKRFNLLLHFFFWKEIQSTTFFWLLFFSVNYCGSKRTIFLKINFPKMRIFRDRQKFLTQKVFFVKNICPYNAWPNLRPKKLVIPVIVVWSIFQKHSYFQKTDL